MLERLVIAKPELEQVKELARKLNVTLSVLFISVYNLFLHKLSGSEDITVVMPIAGRPKREYEKSIGNYMNLIMVRNMPS